MPVSFSSIRIRPELYALGTFFFAAAMNACVKALGHTIPVTLFLTCRFITGLIIFAPLIYHQGGLRRVLKTNHPYKQSMRSLLSMAAMALCFFGLPGLPLGDSMALWQTQGFFLLLLSNLITGEKVHAKYFLTCGLGFIGVVLILHPQGSSALLPSAMILGAALLSSITTLTIRAVSRKDSELTILTWFFMVCGGISFLLWLFFSPHEALSWEQASFLAGASIFGSLAQITMTRAFKLMGAHAMGSYTHSGVIFSTILGLVFFHEIPTLWMLAGVACIILGIHWNHRMRIAAETI